MLKLVLSEAVLEIDCARKRMKAPASTLHARIKPITRRHGFDYGSRAPPLRD